MFSVRSPGESTISDTFWKHILKGKFLSSANILTVLLLNSIKTGVFFFFCLDCHITIPQCRKPMKWVVFWHLRTNQGMSLVLLIQSLVEKVRIVFVSWSVSQRFPHFRLIRWIKNNYVIWARKANVEVRNPFCFSLISWHKALCIIYNSEDKSKLFSTLSNLYKKYNFCRKIQAFLLHFNSPSSTLL